MTPGAVGNGRSARQLGPVPLFRKAPEPLQRPKQTVNGRPQPASEASGPFSRRIRLFVECERRLADHPLAAASAAGTPVGDGQGLEELVARIAPLFDREQSLIRWVALRGALADLHAKVVHPASAVVQPIHIEQAMGFEWVDRYGDSHLDVTAAWRTKLSPEVLEAVVGVASSVLRRVEEYPRYEAMSVHELMADKAGRTMSRALALDTIAWTAVAMLRLGVAQRFFGDIPEPDMLTVPGWYTEPLFAKAERHWNGTDWTGSCRVRNGRDYVETSSPLE